MSKFEELCGAFNDMLNDLDTYKERCHGFTEQLVDGMVDYFEVPPTNWRYVPFDKLSEPNVQYSSSNTGLEDDGYWHAAVELRLWNIVQASGLTTFDVGLRPIKFHFFIKKKDDDFVVKIDPEHDGHKINPEGQRDFRQFYDHLFQMLKEFLENNLEIFLGQVEAKGSFGFGAFHK